MSVQLSIDELAESTGLTRRAIRFYIQQRLLTAPLGVGRGKHYDESHLERLRRIQELQTAGYSLDAIRRLLDGEDVPQPTTPPRSKHRPVGVAELWTRLKVADGCELHLDVKRFNLDVEQLSAAREMLRSVFGLENEDTKTEGDAKRKTR
jgi:DNA-binding transcriptional MerR regulator